jgi:heat shock protein HtpX
MAVMAFQVVFGMLASIVVMWFSRQREYRADAGGAELAGKQKMIAALQKLQSNQAGGKIEGQLDGQLTAFGISGGRAMGSLFMSHPPLQKRIDVLRGRTV